MKTHDSISNLRKTRQWVRLTPNAQVLFYELAFIHFHNQETKWINCSNVHLCSRLNFSEKTLIKARQELVEANLILFKKRGLKEPGLYSFGDGMKQPKHDQPDTTETGVETGVRTGVGTGENTANKNINNNNKYNNQKEKINKKEKELQEFEQFRQRYPGRKRGLETEFQHFKTKHPDYAEVIPLLTPAIEQLITWRNRQLALGQFVPEYPLLQTWINQRRWEEEQPNTNYYE